MKTALVLLLSLHLGSCCSKDDYLEGRKNSPEFTCLEKDNELEKRQYNSSIWIRTRVHSIKDTELLAAHSKLKTFVSGFQKKYKKMPKVNQFDKTWPVLINHTRDNQLWMSWFVPLELESDNSWLVRLRSEVESSNSVVELLQLPQSISHIWKFPGRPSLEAGTQNMKKLLSRLGWSCPDLNWMEYSGASYESYFSITHHNEIWIGNSSC